MLPPPQAPHTSNPASATIIPPTEIFTGLPPQSCGCKGDAIAKPKHSSQLAPWSGTRFSTAEDVCHYFSGQRIPRVRHSLKPAKLRLPPSLPEAQLELPPRQQSDNNAATYQKPQHPERNVGSFLLVGHRLSKPLALLLCEPFGNYFDLAHC